MTDFLPVVFLRHVYVYVHRLSLCVHGSPRFAEVVTVKVELLLGPAWCRHVTSVSTIGAAD